LKLALAMVVLLGAALRMAPAAEPPWIFSSHDLGGYTKIEQAGKRGWLVVTVAVGHDPSNHSGDDFSFYSNRGHGVIVRLNNGYGSDGTLPYQSQYQDFATRCANYVAATQGADIFIIGNETNLAREWPGNVNGDPSTGEAITVARYVDCYNRCYNAIKAVRPSAQIVPTPSGTWGPPLDGVYGPNRGIEGFLDYWVNILNAIGASRIDALAVHAYTHGCDPALVTDTSKMGPPYQNIYYNFQVYRNYMAAIPSSMRTKPVYITECDQNIECADPPPAPRHAWLNANNGWVKAIYAEINSWNQNPSNQKIRCVTLFRWDDVPEGEWAFGFSNRSGVIADWLEAMANDYRWTATLGTISGYVRDSDNAPVDQATVATATGGYSTLSGPNGFYSMSVAPATYSVTASKSGYVSQTRTNITVNPGQVTNVDFTLGIVKTLASVSQAKREPDGTWVEVPNVVCSRRSGTTLMFVQDADRSCGIRVMAGTGSIPAIAPGTRCTVRGRLATGSDIRRITDVTVTVGSAGMVAPVAMTGRCVGGSDFFYDAGPPVSGQKGIPGSIGPNNVGLLVKTWGRVLDAPSGGIIHIYDGSVPGGIPVRLSGGVTAPAQGSYVSVVGIPEPAGLLVLQSGDIRTY